MNRVRSARGGVVPVSAESEPAHQQRDGNTPSPCGVENVAREVAYQARPGDGPLTAARTPFERWWNGISPESQSAWRFAAGSDEPEECYAEYCRQRREALSEERRDQ